MYMYMYIYIYICVYVCTFPNIRVSICTYHYIQFPYIHMHTKYGPHTRKSAFVQVLASLPAFFFSTSNIYIYICMYIYTYEYIYICTCIHTYSPVHLYMYIYIPIYVYLYVYPHTQFLTHRRTHPRTGTFFGALSLHFSVLRRKWLHLLHVNAYICIGNLNAYVCILGCSCTNCTNFY